MKEFSIAMTEREVAYILSKLSVSKNYYEYGCGGSTLLACSYGPKDLKIHSIDSSSEWVNKMLNNTCIKDGVNSGRLSIQYDNLGVIGDLGYPRDYSEISKNTWHTYSESIYFVKEKVDLVLVDGRFRVACMLQAMLNKPDAVIIVHDFYDKHHHWNYIAILNVADIIENVDTFARIRRKARVSDKQLKIMYEEYKMSSNS